MRRIASMQEILAELGPLAGLTVADIGCGTGDTVRWLVRQGARATGLDKPEMLAKALAEPPAGGEKYLAGEAQALPLDEDGCDLLIYGASFHHVPVELMPRALAEARRVLRAGGRAFFLEPVARPGSYFELVRLESDEREIQATAHRVIESAAGHGFRQLQEDFCYFERSFADFERLIGIFVDEPARRTAILEQARLIVEKQAAASGLAFADVRYQSICRWNLLVKQG